MILIRAILVKGEIMNRRVLSALVIFTVIFFCVPVYSQVSTPVFVVYGNAYDKDGVPVDDNYYITVTNLNTGAAVQTEVESGSNCGRYSVVFIDFSGNRAAAEGDLLEVEALEIGGTCSFICREHTVTASDVESGEVYLEEVIETEAVSWGAVKNLYRAD